MISERIPLDTHSNGSRISNFPFLRLELIADGDTAEKKFFSLSPDRLWPT